MTRFSAGAGQESRGNVAASSPHMTSRTLTFRHRSAIFTLGVATSIPSSFTPTVRGGSPPAENPDAAGTAPADKGRYHLFHPTPENLLRPFKSDRPDQCVGARSVDAGHIYLEGGLLDYSLDLGLSRVDRWSFAPTRLRVGLTNSLEFELLHDGAQNQRTRGAAPGGGRTTETVTDSGALTVRLRQNIFGNDAGKVAFAVVPQVIVPTSTSGLGSSRAVQGTVILPFSIKLPADFDLTVHNEFGALRDGGDTRYEFNSIQGLSLKHNLGGESLSGYVEWFSTASVGPRSTYAEQIDVGLLWRAAKNLQFDAGCNFGVSRDAPDFQPFAGVVARF